MKKLLEMAGSGDVREAVRELSRRISPSRQPAWAAKILDLFRVRYPRIAAVDAVYDVALDRNRWSEAHEGFDRVRCLTLRADWDGDAVRGHLLHLAELVAKVTYNASGEDAPFDADCGLQLIAHALNLADSWNDAELQARVARAVDDAEEPSRQSNSREVSL